MLTVLTGDKVSSGDAFIVDRGIGLLKHFCPDEEILKLKRWEPIDEYINKINESRALILLGGPAIERNIYPGIYPLVKDLSQIRVPIIAMGLGASIIPCNETAINEFRFGSSSGPLLERLAKDFGRLGIRDYITKRILVNNGVQNTEVIGCPAWYNLESLGKQIISKDIRRVAFATGVRHLYFKSRESFVQQCEVMKLLNDKFPKAVKYCVFQDTLENDDYKPKNIIQIQRNLAMEAQKLGYEIVDCTYNLGNMLSTYEQADFLIGYRVHSHICMLSMGKPSVLIVEDSRGYGMNNFVGLKSFSSFQESRGVLDRLYVDGLSSRLMRRVLPFKINPHLIEQVSQFVEQELESDFSRYAGIHEVILRYFKKMEKFITNLPK